MLIGELESCDHGIKKGYCTTVPMFTGHNQSPTPLSACVTHST